MTVKLSSVLINLLWLLPGFLIFLSSCSPHIESGEDVFLKESYAAQLKNYQSFPMSSWSYIVTPKSYVLSEEQIQIVQKSFPVVLDKENPKGMSLLLEDWILDGVFLEKPPESSTELKQHLQSSLSKAQFLEMFKPGALQYVKNDPFARSESFLKIWSDSFHLNNNQKETQGVYRFVPVLPYGKEGNKQEVMWQDLDAVLTSSSSALSEEESHSKILLVGSDYFAKENKEIIMSDLKFVALVGALLGLVLLLILYYFSLYKILFFLPLIGMAMLLSTSVVVWWQGAIHGLVLSFGTSIVGLSLDYAIHAVHAQDKKEVWRKNLIALGTTVLAFGVLYFSTVPLFKGISLFSILGLIFSFVFMWTFDLVFKVRHLDEKANDKFGEKSQSTALGFDLAKVPVLKYLSFRGASVGVVAVTVLCLPALSYNESLKSFMYVPQSVKPIMENLENSQSKVLVRITDLDESGGGSAHFDRETLGKKTFGLKSFIGEKGFTKYENNAEAWTDVLGGLNLKSEFSGFFDNYKNKLLKQKQKNFDLRNRLYTSLFVFDNQKLDFYSSAEPDEIKKARDAGFWSPSDFVNQMGSETLIELIKLLGLALLISIVLLGVLLRNIQSVLKIYFPFVSALMLFFILSIVFSIEINLVHMIGMLIVFGISMDYGVFGSFSGLQPAEEKKEVLSSFKLTAVTTFFGFAPLLFTTHPVLSSLGVVLVSGIVGSYCGGRFMLIAQKR